MDREKLLNHIKDQELKKKLIRCLDMVEKVLYNHEIKNTDFLNPYELREFLSILRGIHDIKFHISDDIEESERKIVYMYPEYFEREHIENALAALKITGNSKFRSVSHRDYLGSVMGLDIVREKIGDIYVYDDKAYVVVMENISDFLLFNLNKIANLTVKVEKVDINQVEYIEPEYKEVTFTVSSMRLDSILAGIFNISRSVASNLISAEKVMVDYEQINSNSKQLKGNEIISARGFGRARFLGIEYTTKKDRLKVKAKRYV